ncbi:hypothetical protein X975_14693, partial [Stegodyphus mimosarum]
MEKEKLVDELTAKHLWNIGNLLSTTCPAASRFYMFSLERKLIHDPDLFHKKTKRSFLFCNHCGSLWSSENHRVHIQAPSFPNRHIKKLLRYERDSPWKLNNHQKRKLRKFKEATSKIIYSCFSCKKKTLFQGIKRTRCASSNILTSTPVPVIKYKKANFTAGLFIPLSSEKKPQDNIKIQEDCVSPKLGLSSEFSADSNFTISSLIGNVSSEDLNRSLVASSTNTSVKSGMNETPASSISIKNRISKTPKSVNRSSVINLSNSTIDHKNTSRNKLKKTLLARV